MKSIPTGAWRLDKRASLLKDFAPTIKDLGDRQIKFTISTGNPDRHGDTVDPNGWETDNFMKNPVVLYGHNYNAIPIGKATEVYKSGNALVAVAKFTTADLNPMGDQVYRMLKAGYLRATSVGFLPKSYAPSNDRSGYDFTKQELLEFSVVPVPANADCLARSIGGSGSSYTDADIDLMIKSALDHTDRLLGLSAGRDRFYSAAEVDSMIVSALNALEARGY